MSHDISQSVPQGSIGAQDAENCRIEAIADELRRRCQLYEAQRRDSQQDVDHFKAEQRVSEAFTVLDLIPRNVLCDQDGDIFVVDAEIKRNQQ